MASIERRNGLWRARYRTPDGRSTSKSFARKVEAERFLTGVEHSKLTGAYVDPSAGKVTFKTYAEAWRASQVQHRPTTASIIESGFRNHVYPVFGDRPMASIRPSELQAFVASLELAPATVRVLFRFVSSVFHAAVTDRVLAASPAVGVKLPEVARPEIVPLEPGQVLALAGAIAPRYRGLIWFAAGTGARQGECFGLTVDRVDFLRRSVLIDRQLVDGVHAPTKTRASVRAVPLPDVVLAALSEHMRAFPADDGLVFTNSAGRAIQRSRFSHAWRAGVAGANLPTGTRFHDLRHGYASTLIAAGESVKVVQARLGHASAAETLNTYSHLWPDSDGATRHAIDAALGTHLGHTTLKNTGN